MLSEGKALRGLLISLAVFGLGFIGHIVLHMVGWHGAAVLISYATGLVAFSFPIWGAYTAGFRFLNTQAVYAWYASAALSYGLAYAWLWGLNGQTVTETMWLSALLAPLSSVLVYPFLLPEPVEFDVVWGGKVYPVPSGDESE